MKIFICCWIFIYQPDNHCCWIFICSTKSSRTRTAGRVSLAEWKIHGSQNQATLFRMWKWIPFRAKQLHLQVQQKDRTWIRFCWIFHELYKVLSFGWYGMIPNLTPATGLPTATLEMQPQPMCCFPVVSPDNDSWSRGVLYVWIIFEELVKLVNNHELPGSEFLTKPLHQNRCEVRDALTSLNEKLREVRLLMGMKTVAGDSCSRINAAEQPNWKPQNSTAKPLKMMVQLRKISSSFLGLLQCQIGFLGCVAYLWIHSEVLRWNGGGSWVGPPWLSPQNGRLVHVTVGSWCFILKEPLETKGFLVMKMAPVYWHPTFWSGLYHCTTMVFRWHMVTLWKITIVFVIWPFHAILHLPDFSGQVTVILWYRLCFATCDVFDLHWNQIYHSSVCSSQAASCLAP